MQQIPDHDHPYRSIDEPFRLALIPFINMGSNTLYAVVNNPRTFLGFFALLFASGLIGTGIDCLVYKHSSFLHNLMYGKFNNLAVVILSTLSLLYIVYRNKHRLGCGYFLLSCLPALGYVGGSAIVANSSTHSVTLQTMWRYSNGTNQLPTYLASAAFLFIIITICMRNLGLQQAPAQPDQQDNENSTNNNSM